VFRSTKGAGGDGITGKEKRGDDEGEKHGRGRGGGGGGWREGGKTEEDVYGERTGREGGGGKKAGDY